jgi:hypothetical protein
LLLLILWGRVFYGSVQDFKTGETLLRENQTIRAITYFDRSLHWYAPFNPYLERAATRLWEIGDRAEKEGIRMARIAFESIRNACYGTSHVQAEWITRPNHGSKSWKAKRLTKGRAEPRWGIPRKPRAPMWGGVCRLWSDSWVGRIIIGFLSLRSKDRRRKPFLKPCVGLSDPSFWALWVAGMVRLKLELA